MLNLRLPGLALTFALLLACSGSDDQSGGNGPGEDGDQGPAISDSEPKFQGGDGSTSDPGEGAADAGDGTASDGGAGADTFESPYECVPGTRKSCTTVCGSKGSMLCLKEWGPCVPPTEDCENCVDDDCDGLVNEKCLPNPECQEPVEPTCPVAVIELAEEPPYMTGTTLHLTAEHSSSPDGAIVKWKWSVQAPVASTATFAASDAIEKPTFTVDVAGQYLFSLKVWDEKDNESCQDGQLAVLVDPYPPVDPAVGCADEEREGFVDLDKYRHIAGCSGAWDQPGVSPTTIVPTCGRAAGDDGTNKEGTGCSSADLCATGWHICDGWQEVAAKSPTGCAGSTPPDAAPKSLLFAVRQPSENNTVCGQPGDGFNDVFGCGNLGHGIAPDKGCGPLDRALASTQEDSCGFNEAEPHHGPWECIGGAGSDLKEGETVTKKGCPASNPCEYDGKPIRNWDKGGVLCCRD